MISRKQKNHGFTIIELMIATMVFSVVLLLCMVGVTRMGRLYYKGISQAQTQEVARRLSDEIVSQLQFGKGNVTPNPIPATATNGGVPFIFCIGDFRYRLVLNRQLANIDSASLRQATRVFERERLAGSVCPDEATTPFGGVGSERVELLSRGMRISRFSISEQSNKLWDFSIQVTYGDEDLLLYPAGAGGLDTPARFNGVLCNGSVAGAELCAVSALSTNVYRRL